MARIAGRNGRVYLAITSGGTASPLPFLASWGINFATDKIETTAMGDANKVYVSGLPDCSGQVSGFYDDSTAQSYTAATDGIARPMYIYPSILTASQYWYGQALIDFNVQSSVSGAVEFNASWNAASAWAKIG